MEVANKQLGQLGPGRISWGDQSDKALVKERKLSRKEAKLCGLGEKRRMRELHTIRNWWADYYSKSKTTKSDAIPQSCNK
jgi:hypothetical protein